MESEAGPKLGLRISLTSHHSPGERKGFGPTSKQARLPVTGGECARFRFLVRDEGGDQAERLGTAM